MHVVLNFIRSLVKGHTEQKQTNLHNARKTRRVHSFEPACHDVLFVLLEANDEGDHLNNTVKVRYLRINCFPCLDGDLLDDHVHHIGRQQQGVFDQDQVHPRVLVQFRCRISLRTIHWNNITKKEQDRPRVFSTQTTPGS